LGGRAVADIGGGGEHSGALSFIRELAGGELRLAGPPLSLRTARERRGKGESRLGHFRLGPWSRPGTTRASRKERGGEKQTGPPVSLGQTEKVKERIFLFYFLKT
jgi:hypothetical protein